MCYDLTVNLNTSSCRIVKIDTETQETFASGIIWVTFLDTLCGKSLRTELRRLYKPGFSKTWTPFQPAVREFSAGKDGQAHIQNISFL